MKSRHGDLERRSITEKIKFVIMKSQIDKENGEEKR